MQNFEYLSEEPTIIPKLHAVKNTFVRAVSTNRNMLRHKAVGLEGMSQRTGSQGGAVCIDELAQPVIIGPGRFAFHE